MLIRSLAAASLVGALLAWGPAAVSAGPAAAVPEADGAVLPFGSAKSYGSLAGDRLAAPVVAMAADPAGAGYWLVTANGEVRGFGAAKSLGGTTALRLDRPIVGMAPTPTGKGYWLVAGDGGVFTFGDARYHGGTVGIRLNRPIVGMAATHDGGGYWLVAGDGGVFTFGDARYHGGTAGIRLNKPIVGMAPTPSGLGYWLVGGDGGVFRFGDAKFHGSLAAARLPQPIVGLAPTGDGGGYWLADADGQVWAEGDAHWWGSAGGDRLTHVVAGFAAMGAGTGYWLVEGAAEQPLAGKVVVIDPGHNGLNYTDPGYIDRLVWNGREYETCDTTGTETDTGYTEARFNWNVANYLAADLRAQGAKVILTRPSNAGVGPCVTVRAAIGNAAHASAAVAIHADGGPPGGRGYAVLTPVADGPNDGVIGSSDRLGVDLRNSFGAGTGEPVSSYDGVDGLQPRDNLAGINLTTVPKVFIECANMRNTADAALVVQPAWQRTAASGIDRGLVQFLTGT